MKNPKNIKKYLQVQGNINKDIQKSDNFMDYVATME